MSSASNLVPGDTNGSWDAFIHDRQTGETSRVSVSSSGLQGDSGSFGVSISEDGRFVAFSSYAGNLVPGFNHGPRQAYVRDRLTGITSCVSVSSTGQMGTGDSEGVSISGDGRYVAFHSIASNLVPGDTNATYDVFVHDRQLGVTSRVSVSSSGQQGSSYSFDPAIRAEGRYVAFNSNASNLVPGDTNGKYDVFVHDRLTGITSRVSVSSTGVQGNNFSFEDPSISADGRYVAFGSDASNLVPGDTNGVRDVFVHDRQTGETSRVSVTSLGVQSNRFSSWGISMDLQGRFVSFVSYANNLVAGDTNEAYDAFVHDRETNATFRVSVSSLGEQGNTHGYGIAISPDGQYVVFPSAASNLVLNDTNGFMDVFVHQHASVIISGRVELRDYIGDATAQPITFEIRPVGQTLPLYVRIAYPAVDGSFLFPVDSLAISPGLYDITAKGATWLRRRKGAVTITSSGAGGVNFEGGDALVNGDADGDNEIAIGDYAILSAAYGSSPGNGNWLASADFNGDLEVSIGDFAILSANFGLEGD